MDKALQEYKVIAEYAEQTLIEKKSRFIARVWPVISEQEAIACIKKIREQHWDARHNVYAYILREGQITRYSDDGEPQGTSGLPTLGVFQSEQIYNVCCVVTRYFGGILLGTGGLVRAYSKAAKLALDAAGILVMRQWCHMLVSCEYSYYERIKNIVTAHSGVVEKTDFSADVLMEVLVPVSMNDNFVREIVNISAGTIEPITIDTIFRGARVN